MATTIASTAQSITSPFAAAARRALHRAGAIAAAMLLLVIAQVFPIDAPASADDVAPALRAWVVQGLKGAAFSRPHDAAENQWQALRMGARIEPGSIVRTDGSGRAELTNGVDIIRLSPSAEVELPAGKEGDPVTRVIHWIGTAFFHVGKRPGPQFEVDTPYIVAIVKGTKFTTTVSDAGAAIKVSEGVVGVSATAGGSSIDVTAGGSASVSAAHGDTVVPGPSGDAGPVSGRGKNSALTRSGSVPAADADAESGTGGTLSGGADSEAALGGSATTRSGRGDSNGNGRGRDNRGGEGRSAAMGNGGGQGGVNGDGDGDGDDGGGNGGCFGHGGHHHGNHHSDHDNDGYRD